MYVRKDLTGQRFGKLIVVAEGEKKKGRMDSYWICVCDCGNTTNPIAGYNLRKGITKSCGCYRKAVNSSRDTNHGMSGTHIYKVWESMKSRCFNSKTPQYKYYGARGITMCPEWKNSFMEFYDFVSRLPHFDEPGYTIDRINNDGNYEPGNVRWATMKEQQNNKRNRRSEL